MAKEKAPTQEGNSETGTRSWDPEEFK